MLTFGKKDDVLPAVFYFIFFFFHICSATERFRKRNSVNYSGVRQGEFFSCFLSSCWNHLIFDTVGAVSGKEFRARIIAWLLALNLCQKAADCQILVPATEMLLSLSPCSWHSSRKQRGNAGRADQSRAPAPTLNCSINLMRTLSRLSCSCCASNKSLTCCVLMQGEVLCLWAEARAMEGRLWGLFHGVFVSSRAHAAPGALQSQLLKSSRPSKAEEVSHCRREIAKDCHWVITVHTLVTQWNDRKIKDWQCSRKVRGS